MSDLKPITPGELLREELLLPMGISQYRLAREIGVPAQRISEIVSGKRAITADTDLRLCRFSGLSNGYWLRAQVAHDTEVAQEALAQVLERINLETAVGRPPGCVPRGVWHDATRRNSGSIPTRCNTARRRAARALVVVAAITRLVSFRVKPDCL